MCPIMVWWEQRIEAANRAAANPKPIRGGAQSQTRARQVETQQQQAPPRDPAVRVAFEPYFSLRLIVDLGIVWLVPLDFEMPSGIDCDRCWPIKYLKSRPCVCGTSSWARRSLLSTGRRVFLAQRLQVYSVLNIAEVAVSIALKRLFCRRREAHKLLLF
jgi:hypothetical protein